MDVTFKTQHAAVDEAVQEYTTQRLTKLERVLPAAREVVVEVRHERTRDAQQRYTVQVTVNANGTFLRAEERAADPRIAVDAAVSALGKQARRHKAKTYRSGVSSHRARHLEEQIASRADADEEDEAEEEEELIAGKLVRVKRFAVKPMGLEEAVEQMELLSHNFFLYYDAAEHQYSLLYRRRDGDYGLIVPDKG